MKAKETTDRYEWYVQALAGFEPPIHENTPQCGYFRSRNKNGRLVRAAIWLDPDDNELRAEVDGAPANPLQIWTWVCQRPISYEEYKKNMDTGGWSDVDDDIPPAAGHNQPPDEDEVLKSELESALKTAEQYKTVTDDDASARAISARNRISELRLLAEKRHTVEKAPSLEECRRIDKKWKPSIKMAETVAKNLATAVAKYLDKKEAEAREAQAEAERKARAAALAEAQKREKDDAEREASATAAEPPAPAQPVAPVEPQIAPGYGRKANVTVVKIATVVDQLAVYRFFHEHEDVQALLAKLAQRATNDGHTVPGIKIKEERKVR